VPNDLLKMFYILFFQGKSI